MTGEQQERIVKAFEEAADALRRIARAHEGIEQWAKDAVAKTWPEPKIPREAKVSHVPTEEEKLKESQRGTEESDGDWIAGLSADEEFIGERERQWIKEHPENQPGGESRPSQTQDGSSQEDQSKA